MVDFETLMREHDMLGTLADRLSALAADRPCGSETAAVRASLAAALDHHLGKEDRDIYPRLAASADQATSTAAREMNDDYDALTAAWAAYMRRWPAAPQPAERADFTAATQTLMARLKARIARENNLLYPLALRGGHIRLRAA